MVDNVKIISYLNILELSTNEPISEEMVKEAILMGCSLFIQSF